MKFPIQSFGKLGSKLGESEYLLPVLYFAGAAGGIGYGTYALIDHWRGAQRGVTAGRLAKIGLPVLIGSGLAVLGARDLRGGKPIVTETPAAERRSRVARRVGRAVRSRARSRLRAAADAM
jgi:hypothetical protein